VAAVGLAGGVVSLAAYGLVLWAQRISGELAALRETSIVIGALIGAAVFGERLGARRAVAAAVVVAGVALLAVA
jgi:drug/metabolite transporter (DMT)-like permease